MSMGYQEVRISSCPVPDATVDSLTIPIRGRPLMAGQLDSSCLNSDSSNLGVPLHRISATLFRATWESVKHLSSSFGRVDLRLLDTAVIKQERRRADNKSRRGISHKSDHGVSLCLKNQIHYSCIFSGGSIAEPTEVAGDYSSINTSEIASGFHGGHSLESSILVTVLRTASYLALTVSGRRP